MPRLNADLHKLDFLSHALIVLSILVSNVFFQVISGFHFFLILIVFIISLYLNILHSSLRKKISGRVVAVFIGVYNPLALTLLIVLVDYRTMLWLLLYMLIMLRNPYLGLLPSIANGIVSVICYIFLATKVYNLTPFEIFFGSLVFFVASILAWVLTQKLWKFEQQSMRDGLTGLRNYRSMNMALKQEIKRCLTNKQPISLLMIDIDNFKKYNDTMGHIKGDITLRKVAKIMSANIRDNDMIFRYGGEEFCVLLPGVPLEKAKSIAERMRAQVEESFSGHDLPVTISIGVSISEGDIGETRQLLELADKALYRAKILKNRVVVFGTDT